MNGTAKAARTTTLAGVMGGRAASAIALTCAALLLAGALAPRAKAGSYSVAQCLLGINAYAQDQFFWTTPKARPAYQARDNDCTRNELSDSYERHATGVIEAYGGSQGDVGGMIFQAPYGTKITWATFGARLVSGSGNQPRVYFEDANATNQSMIFSGDSGGWQTYSAGAYHDRFVAAIRCWQSSCPLAGSRAAVQDMRFVLTDISAPWITAWGGSLVSGGWKSGAGYSLSASAHDYGGGVRYLYVYANGQVLASQDLGCPDRASGYFASFSGCYGNQTRGASWGGLSTQQGGLREGTNTITACAYDLADSGSANTGCSNATVHVDNVAPSAPSALSLAGPGGWRAANDFDLSWANPAQSCDCSGLAATHYRLTGPGGYDSGDQRVGLTTRFDNLGVPGRGEYTLSTWAEDGAGNHNPSAAQSAQLRFDDTVPPTSEATSSGWLERSDFPYALEWSRPEPSALGPSGLSGYAVVIDDRPDTDPCMADGEPGCSTAELSHPGGAEDSREVLEDYRGGSEHYVHVVAVSGAGVKASAVGHTSLPVDKRDPETEIVGVPSGWVNRDVKLTVRATDTLSGMEPDAHYPDDPGPRTTIRVGSGAEQASAGDRVATTIADEGVHNVRFWARDLAGNENDGQIEGEAQNDPPGTAVVRIDKTAPQLAFQNAESKDDPSLITAPVSDALSGVVSGEIAVRPEEGGEWTALNTELREDRLQARVPDNLSSGRYEMRASATDDAGNTAISRQRADGSAMAAELPLKTVTELVGGIGEGQGREVTLAYGRPSEVTGVLRTETGAPLADAQLTVVESFGPGSRSARGARTVRTDPEGQFSVPLSAGPSRTISVRYEGTRRNFAAELGGLQMKVRGAVLGFNAPRSVSEHREIVFSGRIGTLGVYLGKLGKLIELQYLKSPGDWKTIRTGRAKDKGRFRIAYALRNDYSQPARVLFRVRVPKERLWPYAGSARSRVRATVIRPHRG